MPEAEVNGVKLYYELHGSGEPLALVHGAWVDATAWRFVVPGLAENFRVLSYDRRGHSRSERPATQGSFDEDGDDLAALLEALELAPAHVVTNSGGGNIALRLATRRPELFRSLSCHEPALWGLLEEDPESQELLQQALAASRPWAGGSPRAITRARRGSSSSRSPSGLARGKRATARGEGRSSSRTLPPSWTSSRIWTAQDRGGSDLASGDTGAPHDGSESTPVFRRVIDRLAELIPRVTRETIEGAAHVPHLTTPERYVELTTRAVLEHARQPEGGTRSLR